MKVHLHRLGKTQELQSFVDRMNINEQFYYEAPFIFVAKDKGSLVFVNAFCLEKVKDKVMPRFIHVLLDESIRHSKLTVNLLNQSEGFLKLAGYTETFAYILNENKVMSVLAKKFGYIPDGKDSKAQYYFKSLIKER